MIIGAVSGKDTTSAPPTEIIWNEGLRVERVPSGLSWDELFIGGSGISTSLSFFDSNFWRWAFFSSKFNRVKDKESSSCLYTVASKRNVS